MAGEPTFRTALGHCSPGGGASAPATSWVLLPVFYFHHKTGQCSALKPILLPVQSSRIDDQRCAPPDSIPRGPTMPDEDFFSLIQRVQAKRMDEQRVDLASAQEEAAEEQQSPGSS